MKKKILLSSMVTIVLCLCLIAGSTFALFTSTSSFGIAVNAAKVKMIAGVDALETYSVAATPNGSIKDELGGTYEYEGPITNDVFTNGGSAKFENGELTISKMTPGDKVTFNITGANESNITVRYRYIIKVVLGADNTLLKGLKFTINNEAVDSYMKSYTSAWMELSEGVAMPSVPVVIELPVNMGNDFQEKEAKINVTVEAIQGNADVDITTTEPTIEYYNDATTAANVEDLLADPLIDSVKLTQDIAEPVELNNVSNKTIDAQGNSAVFEVEATATLNNVVIKNLVDDDGGVSAITIKSGAKGDLTLENCVIGDGEQRPINGASNPDLSLTLKECEVSNYNYAAYFYALKNLVLEECIFNGSAANSWAVLINGDIKGNFTVNKCTFNGCNDGIVKAGVGGNNLDGTVGKVFTFTNNILTNCAGHDGVDAKMFGIKYVVTPVISGNTFNGAAWAEIETNYNSYGVVAK